MYDDDYLGSRLFYSVILIVLIYAALQVPNHLRARCCGQFTQCQSNCKNIGTALEMYSTDNGGNYPTSMSLLTPNYLKTIPTCASARKDSYSRSYSSSMGPDAYTFFCSGENHKAIGISRGNYPQYNSTEGLIARP